MHLFFLLAFNTVLINTNYYFLERYFCSFYLCRITYNKKKYEK